MIRNIIKDIIGDIIGDITNNPPVNTVAPVVSGTAKNGETLTTTNGTWDNSPNSFTYQWQNNGVDITGATSQTYLTTYTDIGDDVRCVVTAQNEYGSTSANSNALSIVSQISTTNLAFWGTASDETSITSSSNSVSTWISANENGNNLTQVSALLQPETGTTSENGLNTLNFANDYLTIPSALHSLPNGNNTIFIVPKVTNLDSFTRRFISFGNGANQRLNIQYQQSSGTISFLNSSTGIGAVSTTATLTNLNIITTKRNGTEHAISVNGGAFVTNNNATDAADVNGANLCGNSNGTGFTAICEMAEVIIYNAALSGAEISAIQTYLSNKWNITLTP